ncbi:hypothetical protein [Cryobacterium sp. TMT3-29-2]|uniref:hypothetical protein n=1 Tax=Cryobacterium sp. TMT3-29-2 TaxID=2555867 RepID=UPI0010737D87|nr:hypothetical protein [Cryobacterium sp. TMT3-29-2]TFC86674.1 hypothetical protein E3O67_10280 [Cryobacterium sp. TMT3-29-2]
MPTGAKHNRIVHDPIHGEGGMECRCTIGEDHLEGDDSALSNYLSESDAEDIWNSSGRDEDYDFR